MHMSIKKAPKVIEQFISQHKADFFGCVYVYIEYVYTIPCYNFLSLSFSFSQPVQIDQIEETARE